MPHNFIKEKLINLIEWTFKREGSPYIACNERQAFFTSGDKKKRYKLRSCQNVCEALIYLLDNIYIRFGTKLNKANTSYTEAPFLDLHLSISNVFVSSKIYDKRDDFDFDIVNFPFLDGDVPRSTSYGVYISQLIRFARVSSHVADFNARNKSLTAKLFQQGYRLS